MQLISPDVLADAKGLSAGAAGFFALVGTLLWAFGWRWHRFWIVFGMTAAAGTVGLSAGKAAGGQVIAIGVLLAFAGGVMALELAKILSFAAGGVGAWLAVQAVLPGAREMWAVFLAGGLLGVILHRLWLMMLTSSVGVLVSWHAGFALAEALGKFDGAKWAAENAVALNGAAVAAAVVGILVQSATAGGVEEKKEKSEKKKKSKKENHHHDEDDHNDAGEKKSGGWLRLPGRKAA